MSDYSLPNSLPVSVRIYRAMLMAYPKRYREHYETQMVQVFRDSFREAHQRNGTAGVIDLWLHTFADLLITALIERLTERSQYMFSPKLIVWGSIASVFGGLMWLLVAVAWQNEGILPSALLLTLGGLLAIHLRLGKQAGVLGPTGFVFGLLGTGMVLYLLVKDWISRNSFSFESSLFDALLFVLGMGFLGAGCILIGLRTRRTEILPTGRSVPLVLGVLYIGFGTSLGLLYYLATVRGIDPWNPTTIPAVAVMLLTFPIGILWMVLGAILAGDAAGLRTSNPPSTSA